MHQLAPFWLLQLLPLEPLTCRGGLLFAWYDTLCVPFLLHAKYRRRSSMIITLIWLSCVRFIIFGIQQSFCLLTSFEHRLLGVQYFESRTLVLLFVMSAPGGALIFILVYFIPLFSRFTKGHGALDVAVRLLFFVFFLVSFSLANGAIMGKEGHYAPWYLGASVLIIIGSALMYTVDENTSTAQIYGYSIVLAIGA